MKGPWLHLNGPGWSLWSFFFNSSQAFTSLLLSLSQVQPRSIIACVFAQPVKWTVDKQQCSRIIQQMNEVTKEAPPENLHSRFLSQSFQLRMGLETRPVAFELIRSDIVPLLIELLHAAYAFDSIVQYVNTSNAGLQHFKQPWLCCCRRNMHIRKRCSPHMFAGARDRGEAVCCYSTRKGAPSGKPSEPTFTLSSGPFWEKIMHGRHTGCVLTLSMRLCANTQSLNQQNTVVISYHQTTHGSEESSRA